MNSRVPPRSHSAASAASPDGDTPPATQQRLDTSGPPDDGGNLLAALRSAGGQPTLMVIDNGDTSFEIDEPDDDEDDGATATEATDLMRHSLSKHHVMIDIVGPLTDEVIAQCHHHHHHHHSHSHPHHHDHHYHHSHRHTNDNNNNVNDVATVGGAGVLLTNGNPPASSSSSASKRHYFIAAKAAKSLSLEEPPSTDSSISMGSVATDASTTPTTADVADVVHVVTTALTHGGAHHPAPPPLDSLQVKQSTQQQQQLKLQQQQQQRHLLNNGSITDDNTSGSIATTTTEIDSSLEASTAGGATSPLKGARLEHAPSLSMLHHPPTAAGSSGGSSVFPQIVPILSTEQTATGGHTRTLSASTSASMRSLPPVVAVQPPSRICEVVNWICFNFKNSGIGEPSVYHALVVIFLEFFSWGLLTMPVISVLNQTFPDHTFLMNGLVMGIKGILSFLSAPLVGALSDIWGRKFFLLITVFFTCAPIPLMTINTWWFFALISISGVFAVTFSVVFAYVADVTTVEERSRAYGLVSATFAASLVISPALGAILMELYSDTLVVALATAIAVLDVFFILVAVPESLPEKVRPASWGAPISWEQADPFAALRKVGTDHTILMQCVTVLLSYLPEAGQYSCIFVYLKLKMGFNAMEVAIFIAVVGVLSISVQVTLGYLMRVFGAKRTIVMGLLLEMVQLLWYGFGSEKWMMWGAGILAALGSVTYPAISAFVSIHSNADSQGAVQGMVTGMRGLCNGLGPAMFGVIFYLFNVDLNDDNKGDRPEGNQTVSPITRYTQMVAGPPFVFGALMVLLAILVAIFIPEARGHVELTSVNSRTGSERKRSSMDGHRTSSGPLAPLMRSDSLAQL